MANPGPLLGSYFCEDVVITLSGIKTGATITPSQFGEEARISIGGREVATSTEGQGGGVVVSHMPTSSTEMTLDVLPTEPHNKDLDAGVEAREFYKFTVADHSGTGKASGICWVTRRPPWERAKTARNVQWTFGVKMTTQQTGQTTIIQ